MIAFKEVSPVCGVAAVGQGPVDGARVSFAWWSAAGSGTSSLMLRADGRELSGTLQDATGRVSPVRMTRG